ncbi:Mediator of RNA polymerase II transcription subunit 27 [Labeo rohita]|uniref:Mediator of RNA polymerase II transcription subunit 27 n=1 Tax=Labeo rohita TaxID=84645 RepID=A0ABQ8MG75_LABRO|nr:Mediator of RNA polymerase II transcription subunit 27 [Labeo rohita]
MIKGALRLDIWSKSNYQAFQKTSFVPVFFDFISLQASSPSFDSPLNIWVPVGFSPPSLNLIRLELESSQPVGQMKPTSLVIFMFTQVTDHATTALLHYQLPQMPDVVVRSFMTWLRSYIKLFQTPCQRCGKYLQEGLPPTWRDFRTLEAFHDTCRQ